MIINSCLTITLVICLYTDLRYRLILNNVTYPAMLIGVVLSLINSGFSGLCQSIIGFIVGGLLLLIPFMLGGIGAGDVKLLALIGVFKGYWFVFVTSIYMSLIGGLISLIIILASNNTLEYCKTLIRWVFLRLHSVNTALVLPELRLRHKFPYGIAIVGGALICLSTGGVLN